jgi:tetratricopeptide (TPR) repeat protein
MQFDLWALLTYILVILIAGAFGGIINYYLELEDKEKDKQRKFLFKRSVFLGIGAAFLVPLFLHLIGSDLMKFEKVNPKEILVFLGFCLVASISSKKFIQTLSTKILKEVREAKEKVKEVKENVENQNIINARALQIVENLIDERPNPDEPPVNENKLKEKIKSASIGTRIEIFRKARAFRRNNYEKNPAIIDKVIPVFESLIEADVDDVYHRNHGQLAYILKDKIEKDYQRAEEELTRAIEIRDKTGVTGFLLYEINRAICKIVNDPDFKEKKQSSKESKRSILEDLKKAAKNDYLRNEITAIYEPGDNDQKEKNTIIKEWLEYNNIDINSIIG